MSSDTEIADGISAWLRDDLGGMAVPALFLARVAREVSVTPQQRRWWPSPKPRPHTTTRTRRSPIMFALSRVVPVIAAVSLVTLYVGLNTQVQPGGSPGTDAAASATPGPAIVWDTGLVRLTAAAMRIREGDRTFTGDVPDVDLNSSPGSDPVSLDDPSDPTHLTFEASWTEQGVDQKLNLYLAFDETDWWVSELRTYDGYCDSDWIYYSGPLFKAPLGQAFEGDVRLTGGLGRIRDRVQVTGSLEFDSLSLERTGSPSPSPTPRVARTPDPAPSVTPGPEPTCAAQPAPAASEGSVTAPPVGSVASPTPR